MLKIDRAYLSSVLEATYLAENTVKQDEGIGKEVGPQTMPAAVTSPELPKRSIPSEPSIIDKIEETFASKVVIDDIKFSIDKFPIVLKRQEQEAMNLQHVVNIITGAIPCPSEQAGLKGQPLPRLIQTIDGLFKLHLNNYEDLGKVATEQDIAEIQKIKKEGSNAVISGLKSGLATAAVVCEICRLSRRISDQTASIMGIFTGIAKGSVEVMRELQSFEERMLRNGSHHRILWLKEIDVREKERLEFNKKRLSNRITILFRDLETYKIEEEPVNIEEFEELKQLYYMWNKLYPNVSIEDVDENRLRKFLEEAESLSDEDVEADASTTDSNPDDCRLS